MTDRRVIDFYGLNFEHFFWMKTSLSKKRSRRNFTQKKNRHYRASKITRAEFPALRKASFKIGPPKQLQLGDRPQTRANVNG